MHMRVSQQSLGPGVKDGEKADPRSQMATVGSDLKQGLGDGAKQESVEAALIVQAQDSEGLGNGEHHMAVGHR